MKKRSVFWLLVSLAVTAIVGMWGAFYAEEARSLWFAALTKPPFYPAEWLLLAGWGVSFVSMAVAAWWIGSEMDFDTVVQVRTALGVYAVPLLLYVGWLNVFFFRHRFGWAALLLTLLWGSVLLTAWAFSRVYRRAGVLMAVPLLWVTYQLYLGIGIASHHSEFLGDVIRRLW